MAQARTETRRLIMAQSEWEKVKSVFYTALNQAPGARLAFLDHACSGNNSLRSQVESLLDSYESGFLEDSILDEPLQTASVDRPLFTPGHSFSHYEIVKLLGRGGMGEVYLADDTALDRLTAIKVIHDDSGLGGQAAARLLREARAAAKLDHPNIGSVYEVGETNGRPFVAMQYVVGETLQFLIAQKAITYDDAVSYARQIAAALAKAHSAGIVHRDIKPANVIVDPEKNLKVLDFGLAKETKLESEENELSAVGLIAGTLSYMSPEHLRAQEVNAQADIWSLGVVLYQMITGRLPFHGESKADLISNVLHSDFEDVTGLPDQQTSINHILHRALQKDRSARYSTIAELEADLDELASKGSVSVDTKRFSTKESNQKSAKANRLKRAALAASLLMILALGGFAVWRNTVSRAAVPFLDRSSGNLQISSLFDLKRQIGGAISDLSFSPDGKTLAFALSEAGTSSIYVLSIAGGTPLRLTLGTSHDHSPVWSPNGAHIAYLSDRDGKIGLWSVPYSGGEHSRLAELNAEHTNFPRLRKWSNDGTRIFFDDGRGPQAIDLHSGIISALELGGIEGKATRGFAISQDESKLIVTSIQSGKEQLWLKTKGTDEAKLISESSPRKGMPEWFPDNNSFAYSADDDGSFQIYIRDLDGATRQVTFSNFSASNPVVSPDGRQIAYVSNIDQANIFQTDIASGKHAMLTQGVNMQLLPSVSPDGRHMAYQTINESTKFMTGQLKVNRLRENEAADVRAKFDHSGCCMQWSPNGERVAYIRRDSTEFHIFTAALADSTERQVATGGISFPLLATAPFGLHHSVFGWSPDGSRIAFVSRRSGKNAVWTVGKDASDATMVAEVQDGTTKIVSPKWSPDGSSIAFLEAVSPGARTQESRIVVSKDGQSARKAEFKDHTILLDWSKSGDGVFVATAAQGSYKVLFVPIDGKGKNRLITVLYNAHPIGILMSPDHRWVRLYRFTR